LKEIQVDVVDNLLGSVSVGPLDLFITYLEMAGKKVLHQGDRPLLESLGKHCVVGVSESLLDNCTSLVGRHGTRAVPLTVPGIVPVQALNIN
jgi:predicted hydrocarbon binding protein